MYLETIRLVIWYQNLLVLQSVNLKERRVNCVEIRDLLSPDNPTRMGLERGIERYGLLFIKKTDRLNDSLC